MAIGIYVFGDIKAIPRVDEMTTSKEELKSKLADILVLYGMNVEEYDQETRLNYWLNRAIPLINEHTKAVLEESKRITTPATFKSRQKIIKGG